MMSCVKLGLEVPSLQWNCLKMRWTKCLYYFWWVVLHWYHDCQCGWTTQLLHIWCDNWVTCSFVYHPSTYFRGSVYTCRVTSVSCIGKTWSHTAYHSSVLSFLSSCVSPEHVFGQCLAWLCEGYRSKSPRAVRGNLCERQCVWFGRPVWCHLEGIQSQRGEFLLCSGGFPEGAVQLQVLWDVTIS